MHETERPGPAEHAAPAERAVPAERAGPSRRRLLAGAGAAGAGVLAGGLAGYFTGQDSGAAGADASDQTIPFYGTHQAGIATPAQDRLAFGSLNAVTGATAADVRDLLHAWTRAAADMTACGWSARTRSRTRRRSTPARRSGRRCPG